MAHFLQNRAPRVADVHCEKIHFEPGDRLVVSLRAPLEREHIERLRRSLTKWAGVDIEILFVPEYLYSIKIQKNQHDTILKEDT